MPHAPCLLRRHGVVTPGADPSAGQAQGGWAAGARLAQAEEAQAGDQEQAARLQHGLAARLMAASLRPSRQLFGNIQSVGCWCTDHEHCRPCVQWRILMSACIAAAHAFPNLKVQVAM